MKINISTATLQEKTDFFNLLESKATPQEIKNLINQSTTDANNAIKFRNELKNIYEKKLKEQSDIHLGDIYSSNDMNGNPNFALIWKVSGINDTKVIIDEIEPNYYNHDDADIDNGIVIRYGKSVDISSLLNFKYWSKVTKDEVKKAFYKKIDDIIEN